MWTSKGEYYLGEESSHDLVNVCEKRVLKGWANVYRDCSSVSLWPTKREADAMARSIGNRIACVEINQEYEVES
jgi:hypothetical protein